ncbi:MAG: SUMF1/EgtB/PvdO family nonheme iron enzyme [bacterium]
MVAQAPLLNLLHLPALDCAHDTPAPGWLAAFGPDGALRGRRPDVLVCTGLGRDGRAAGIEHAATFLQRLVRPFDTHPVHIWPVPGPGDRDDAAASPLLALAGGLPSAKLFDRGTTAQMMVEPFAAWNAARQRIVGGPMTAMTPWIAQPLSIGDHRVGFFGLNTAWLRGEPIAGAAVVVDGFDGLVGHHRPDVIIGALHHPPGRLRADEREGIDALLGRCDLVLHDMQGRRAAGPPPMLGVEAGVGHWIAVHADRVEVVVLDLRRALAPTGERVSLPLARRVAPVATVAARSDGPPNLASYLGHLRQDWGRVLLHGLVESGASDESQPVGEVYVSLRVDAPHVAEPKHEAAARRQRGGSSDAFDTLLRSHREDGKPKDRRLRTAQVQAALKSRGLPHDTAAVEAACRRVEQVSSDDPRWLEAALTAYDIEQAVGAHRWLLIEGDPGTGKTTTVQAIVAALIDALAGPDDADRTARARAFGFEPPWPVPLPIYFRQFWRWASDRPGDDRAGDALLIDYLRHRLGSYAGGDDWIEPMLREGRALLVFDGLDEMPWDFAHERAVRTVQDAAMRFGGNRCLVTSRPSGLVRGVRAALVDAGLTPFRLRVLTPDQIEGFVGRWYGRLLAPETARVEAADLIERIHRAGLQELAEVPITLVAMAVVHRNSRLPERRVELYEQCIKALLHRWHNRLTEKSVAAYLCGPLTETAKLRIVERLAALAHRDGGDLAVLDREPVLAEVYAALPASEQAKHDAPDDCAPLVEELSERSGLLVREPGRWGWRFRHRAFQEYLTARQWCQEADDNQTLITKLDDALSRPEWHGVIPLALAYKAWNHRGAARAVLDGLLAKAAGRDDMADRVGATAVLTRALHDLRHYDLEWLDEVVGPYLRRWADWIEALGQPGELAARIAVAEALGVFGDPRLGWGPEQFPEVPAGPYVAGTVGAKVWRYDWDRDDNRRVAAYRIARYPVTVAQFLTFVDDPTFADPRWWQAGDAGGEERARIEGYWRAQPPNHPITRVTWYEAMAFCAWATESHRGALGDGVFALPSDEEWEKAARGGRELAPGQPNPAPTRQYPWADDAEPTADRANFGHQLGRATPVGLYPRGSGPYGALDQAGNVWEWCDAMPEDTDRGVRVLRGGAWRSASLNLRVSYRDGGHPAGRSGGIGFRCVWRGAPRSLGA